MRKNSEKNFQDKINDAFKDENFKEIGEIIGEGIDTAIDVTKRSISKFVNKNKRNLPYSIQRDDRIINQNPRTVKNIKTWGILAKTSIAVHSMTLFGLIIDSATNPGSFFKNIPVILIWVLPAILGSYYVNYRIKKLKDQIIRFRKYNREIGNNTVIPTADLAAITAKPIDFTINDLLNMIERDYYRQARIVEEGKLFILDSKTYKLYKEEALRDPHEKMEELENQENSEMAEELILRARSYVTELTQIEGKISSPMDEKIRELLKIVGKIFELLKENPSTAGDLNKAINYYLPTTLKLSNSYLEMKEKPTESVKGSLKDIEDTMDIVIDAFMKILDNIYQEKIMDLSSDMSVLKSMLKQEGLLDKDEFKIGR